MEERRDGKDLSPVQSASQEYLFPRRLDEYVSESDPRGTFEQCYNAQAAVDEKSQIIVAQTVTNAPHDSGQLPKIIEQMEENLPSLPEELSADAGYFTEGNLEW